MLYRCCTGAGDCPARYRKLSSREQLNDAHPHGDSLIGLGPRHQLAWSMSTLKIFCILMYGVMHSKKYLASPKTMVTRDCLLFSLALLRTLPFSVIKQGGGIHRSSRGHGLVTT